MDTTTINGLHRCQSKNEPQVGQVKTFLVIHNPAKQGKKPWIAIKSAPEDKGGTPYRVVSVESTGWEPDQYGNQSYNLEVEAVDGQQGESYGLNRPSSRDYQPMPQPRANAPQAPPARPNGEDGVLTARKHLMRVANLYALCVRCANSRVIADEFPEAHKTNEQFQSTLASIWIESSSRRSTDGVTWWSYIDLMPDTPIKTEKPAPKVLPVCLCDNTDGDNPMCPIHSDV